MEVKECTTCGANLEAEDSFVIFPCPDCGEEKIARCERCKKIGNEYECDNCGFTGP
ncbi:MAG: zinc finger domain-containing protein [Candidatus Nanohaloarchaeota archaeon QJJ-9]|nr:zinc finger domain-containing protein [Candidatus Nanohaloarchaeota archaeon QJJ-9]